MSISNVHHYIPQFYLKGFVNEQKTLAIYDKHRKVLKKGYYSTSTHFFIKNRNTLMVGGIKTDDLEQLYKKYDNELSNFFYTFKNKAELKNLFTPFNLQHIKLFIAMMFWRIPDSDSLLDNFLNKISFDNLGLKILDENGEIISDSMKNEIFNSNHFRQTCRFLTLPLKTFKIFLKESDSNNWHYYIAETNRPHLCCDNPIVFKNLLKFFDFEDDLIFPFSSEVTIIFTRKQRPEILPPDFCLTLDLAIFSQANRYVCSSNREYLKAVSDMYYNYYVKEPIENIKDELFSFLKPTTNIFNK